jgi:hypothetical protein
MSSRSLGMSSRNRSIIRFTSTTESTEDVAVEPIAAGDLSTDEGKVENGIRSSQGVVRAHSTIQIDLVGEQFLLRLVDAHHGVILWIH